MKQLIYSCFLLFAIAGFLASCGGHDQAAKRYEVEQAFFEADRTVKSYSVKPELRTQEDYFRLVGTYIDVYRIYLRNFPQQDVLDTNSREAVEASYMAGRSLLAASALLLTADALDSAQAIFDILLNSKTIMPRHRHDALYAAGKLAERNGRWPQAEELYQTLLKEASPPVERGGYAIESVIELPRYIAEHYATSYDSTMALQKAREAIRYYQTLIDTYPKIPMTMMATRLLAEMLSAIGEYRQSAEVLSTVKDSTGRIFDPAKAMIADLYFTRLDRKADAVRMYKEIISDGIDSNTIATAHLKMAALSFADGRFQEGRDYLDKLKDRFRGLGNLQAQAQLARARSFEDEGNNERARQEYIALLNEYPNSIQALDVLVYLPEYFGRIGQKQLETEWTKRAENELKRLAEQHKNNQMGVQASSYLGTFLIRNKRFEDAIAQFETLRRQFPQSQESATALMKIALTYQNDLQDKPKALESYREFLKQYPQSRVRTTVENEIRKLESSL